VLHEKVACSDLPLSAAASICAGARGAVMESHEGLELFGVGSSRGLPSRLLGGWIEVIWQVLGIRVTNLPLRR